MSREEPVRKGGIGSKNHNMIIESLRRFRRARSTAKNASGDYQYDCDFYIELENTCTFYG